jgi:hypothetical protein
MAINPHFDQIVATVTAHDIEKFLRSNAPEDEKQRVQDAATNEIKMRFVGGYLIRTNQVTLARFNPKNKTKATTSKASKKLKSTAQPA